jgi:hypothetical protein
MQEIETRVDYTGLAHTTPAHTTLPPPKIDTIASLSRQNISITRK